MADIRIRVRPDEYAQIQAAAKDQPIGTFARRELLLHSTQRGATVLLTQAHIWLIEASIEALQDDVAEETRKLARIRKKLEARIPAWLRDLYREDARDHETTIATKQARVVELEAKKAALLAKTNDP